MMHNLYQRLSFSGMTQRFRTENYIIRSKNDIDLSRIDPLDCKTVDIPLGSRNQSSKQPSTPRKFCLINGESQIPPGELDKINRYLQAVVDDWDKSEKQETEVEFQWGSPIKVGTDNGSLDKYPSKIVSTSNLMEKSFDSKVASRAKKFDIVPFNKSISFQEEACVDLDDDDELQIIHEKIRVTKKKIAPLAKTSQEMKSIVNDTDDSEWYEMRPLRESAGKAAMSPEDDFVIPDTEYPKIVTPPAFPGKKSRRKNAK